MSKTEKTATAGVLVVVAGIAWHMVEAWEMRRGFPPGTIVDYRVSPVGEWMFGVGLLVSFCAASFGVVRLICRRLTRKPQA
jgi:hypothetical protein